MPLKILFATDLHLRAAKPILRTDPSFIDTVFAKLENIRELAEDVDLVILGGDIFDRPDAPHSVIIRAIRTFSKFKAPIYTIVGQHDVRGYQGATIETTAMGVLLESGVVKKLDMEVIKGVTFYGLHAYDETRWTVPEASIKVLVAHKLLTNMPIPNVKCYTLKDTAKETNADIILSGDIHYPHNEKVGDVIFVNPGAMLRSSIADRDRVPQVSYITIEDDGEIVVSMQPIRVRPSEAVFNLANYSERMASELHSKEFSKIYAKAIVAVQGEPGDIKNKLADFLEKNGVDMEIRKSISAYRERAENEIVGELED